MLLHLYCFYTLSLVWFPLWGCAHLHFNLGSKWVSGREFSRAQGNHDNIISDDGSCQCPCLTFRLVEGPLDFIVCFCLLLLCLRWYQKNSRFQETIMTTCKNGFCIVNVFNDSLLFNLLTRNCALSWNFTWSSLFDEMYFQFWSESSGVISLLLILF